MSHGEYSIAGKHVTIAIYLSGGDEQVLNPGHLPAQNPFGCVHLVNFTIANQGTADPGSGALNLRVGFALLEGFLHPFLFCPAAGVALPHESNGHMVILCQPRLINSCVKF